MRTRYPMTRPRRQSRRAFTLIEMLIVIAIILLIAGMVVPGLLGRQRQANIDIAKATVGNIEKAVKLYSIDHNGEYPQGGAEIFDELMQPQEVNGRTPEPYLDEIPADPWGQQLNYEYPSDKTPTNKPAVWSNGPNKKDDGGSGDDVGNWRQED